MNIQEGLLLLTKELRQKLRLSFLHARKEAEDMLWMSLEGSKEHSNPYEGASYWKPSQLILHAKQELTEKQQARMFYYLKKRKQGIPLSYVLKRRFFYRHVYQMHPKVFLPRFETEVLLEIVHAWLIEKAQKPLLRGFEFGVGTGVLSLELLSAFSQLQMTGMDANPWAIALTRKNWKRIFTPARKKQAFDSLCKRTKKIKNKKKLKTQAPGNALLDMHSNENAMHLAFQEKRFQLFLEHSLEKVLAKVPCGFFDFFISNPPYLDPKDAIEKDVLQYEPWTALFPKKGDSFFYYELFAQKLIPWLVSGGKCFLEVPSERANQILKLFHFDLGWKEVFLKKDLANRNRVLVAQKK